MADADPVEERHSPAQWWRSYPFYLVLSLGPLYWLVHAGAFGLGEIEFRLNLSFALLVLAYPVIEELVFRGLLQGSLLELRVLKFSVAGITGANLIASVMFAIAHVLVEPTVISAAVLFPSLLFGYLFDTYRTLVPCILTHAFYNLGYLVLWPVGSANLAWDVPRLLGA